VTTNHICARTGISRGNLYYHFRNKSEVAYPIYLRLEAELIVILGLPPEREWVVDDVFVYVTKPFQHLWGYRFFYRDLAWMVESVPTLADRYAKLTHQVMDRGNAIYSDMVKAGVMKASQQEVEWLAVNSWAFLTYWLTYERIHITDRRKDCNIVLGIRQFVSLFYSYLLPDARDYVDRLMKNGCADCNMTTRGFENHLEMMY
jgi:AcrR family transcriptional regulator